MEPMYLHVLKEEALPLGYAGGVINKSYYLSIETSSTVLHNMGRLRQNLTKSLANNSTFVGAGQYRWQTDYPNIGYLNQIWTALNYKLLYTFLPLKF